MSKKEEDVGEPEAKKLKTDSDDTNVEVTKQGTALELTDWEECWEKGKIGFHEENVHEFLEAHADKMLNGREKLKLFMPLCGKSLDMKWLADKGHTVVGVEIAERAIREFFKEQKLEYTTETVDNFDGQVFKSKNGLVRLYCGDLFNFTKDLEGLFDGIWDRASLVAMNRADREKYSKLMLSLMAKDCVYLLATIVYDQSKHPGPPHCTTLETVTSLYGAECSVEEIDSKEMIKDEIKEWGLDSLEERLLLLKQKK